MDQATPLPDHVAAAYGLPEPRFMRQKSSSLCERCDLFFQHATKIMAVMPGCQRDYQSQLEKDNSVAPDDPNSKGVVSYPHWTHFEEVRVAAAAGCHICRLFTAQLRPEELDFAATDEGRPGAPGLMSVWDWTSPSSTTPEYELNLGFRLGEPWVRRFGVGPNSRENSTQLFSSLLLKPQVDEPLCVDRRSYGTETRPSQEDEEIPLTSAKAINLAVQWVSQCQSQHTLCNQNPITERSPPSRLVHLGVSEDFSDVRLCSTLQMESWPIYVTLSHTWGPSGLPSVAKLSPSCIESYEQMLPFHELPRTFQDAIKVARGLRTCGVEYIWIDSLCILQGQDALCKADWLKEGSRMNELYINGVCNLAAAVGQDDDAGLFAEHDPFWNHICVLQTAPTSPLHGTFSIRNTRFLGHESRCALITSRAWCVPELMLPARKLCFAPGRMFWQCEEFRAEGRAPSLHLDGLRDFKLVMPDRSLRWESALRVMEQQDGEFHRSWGECISLVSTSHLTFPTDRPLVASAAAKQLEMAFPEQKEYIFGLWKDRLYLELLWSVHQASRKDSRNRHYLAPSWSWLSSENWALSFPTHLYPVESCTKLVEIRAELQLQDDRNPYGILQAARHGSQAQLHVTGPLLTMQLTRPRNTPHPTMVDVLIDGTDRRLSVILDIAFQSFVDLKAHCLLVATHPNHDSSGNEVSGIVLVRQDDAGLAGRYIRIGGTNQWPFELLEFARARTVDDPSSYEQRLPNGDYQVTIV